MTKSNNSSGFREWLNYGGADWISRKQDENALSLFAKHTHKMILGELETLCVYVTQRQPLYHNNQQYKRSKLERKKPSCHQFCNHFLVVACLFCAILINIFN